MTKSKLIIISGTSGTGKSTLALEITKRFNIVSMSKDEFKEILFDVVGSDSREHSMKIGLASYKIMFDMCEKLAKFGSNILIESNFAPEITNEIILRLVNKYDIKVLSIYLSADKDLLVNRFFERAKTDGRHKGHDELNNVEEFTRLIKTRDHRLSGFPCEEIVVDTNDFSKIDFDPIYAKVSKFLQ